MASAPATGSNDRPFSSKPSLEGSWNALTENVSLVIYTGILTIFLGPISFYYFMAISYVKGSYVSIDEYNDLIFTKKYTIPAILYYLLFLLSMVASSAAGIGFPILIILLATAPLFTHYIATTDESFMDNLKKSIKETINDPSLIIISLVITVIATVVGIVFCGLGLFITLPLSSIHFYNVMVYKKFLNKEVKIKKSDAVSDTTHTEQVRAETAEQAGAETIESLLRKTIRTKEDNATEVNNLIQKGCSSNTLYKNNWSILHEAVSRGHIDTVKVLLDAGADKDSKGGIQGGQGKGRSPLRVAIETGRLDMVKLLIESGSTIDLVKEELIGSAYRHLNKNNQGGEIMRLILDRTTKDSRKWKSWRTIDIINEWKDVCGLGALSSTSKSSSRLEDPYSDLEATLMFQQENALIRFNIEPNVVDALLNDEFILKVRVDGVNYDWTANVPPGSNDIVISSSFVVAAITAWITAKKFCITVPFYVGGNAIFCWDLNGAAAAIGKTFVKQP